MRGQWGVSKLKIHSFKNPCDYRWKSIFYKINDDLKTAWEDYYKTVWGTTKVNCKKCLTKKKKVKRSFRPRNTEKWGMRK